MGRGLEIPVGSLSHRRLLGDYLCQIEDPVTIGAVAIETVVVMEYYGNDWQKVRLNVTPQVTGTRGDSPSYIGISRQDGQALQVQHITTDNPFGGEMAFTEPIPEFPITWDPDSHVWVAGDLELINQSDMTAFFVDKTVEYALKRQLKNRRQAQLGKDM